VFSFFPQVVYTDPGILLTFSCVKWVVNVTFAVKPSVGNQDVKQSGNQSCNLLLPIFGHLKSCLGLVVKNYLLKEMKA